MYPKYKKKKLYCQAFLPTIQNKVEKIIIPFGKISILNFQISNKSQIQISKKIQWSIGI